MAPGLYKVGTPESLSPILVTANYKLTVDALRSALDGVDAWILVLDTKGVNVWCAAGKGTFSTDELVRQVQSTGLSEIVSHRKLVVPQLGAPGIAAHEVRRICGFKVVYGPVRARDIKAYLEAAMDATDDMRRVTFGLGERVEVIGVELTAVLKWIVESRHAHGLAHFGGRARGGCARSDTSPLDTRSRVFAQGGDPGGCRRRRHSGAHAGRSLDCRQYPASPLRHRRCFVPGDAVHSTTFTSPSGVEWEMRRALPFQVGAVVIASGIAVVRILGG
jgi:hypothetical protein